MMAQTHHDDTIFEYCVEASTGRWTAWCLHVSDSHGIGEGHIYDSIRHSDTLCYEHLLHTMLGSEKVPAMLSDTVPLGFLNHVLSCNVVDQVLNHCKYAGASASWRSWNWQNCNCIWIFGASECR